MGTGGLGTISGTKGAIWGRGPKGPIIKKDPRGPIVVLWWSKRAKVKTLLFDLYEALETKI